MKRQKNMMLLGLTIFSGAFLFLFGAPVVFAETLKYVSLVDIPGLKENSTSIPSFINRVYVLTIVIGSLLGVIKIAVAGVKYSTSGVITDKETAKKDILGVLLGLVVLLAPWIVLNTIYPGLLNLDFTKGINNVGIENSSGGNITKEYSQVCGTVGPGGLSEEECKNLCIDYLKDQGGVVSSSGTRMQPGTTITECYVEYQDGDSGKAGEDFYQPACVNDVVWLDVVCGECYSESGEPGEKCNQPIEGKNFNCLLLSPDLRSDGACESWCDSKGGEFDPAPEPGGASWCKIPSGG